MKRFLALAAASLLTLSVPAMGQYNNQDPRDTAADTGSTVPQGAPQPAPMGVDNFVTRSIDNTFGAMFSMGQGQTGIGTCADLDQPRTPEHTDGVARCDDRQ